MHTSDHELDWKPVSPGPARSVDLEGRIVPQRAWGGGGDRAASSGAAPCPDWAAVRRRLSALCDPPDLTAYLGRCFARSERGCDHTFSRLSSYFDADPQQALAVFQFFEELDVRCDCEAFFILRLLTH